MTTTEAHYLDTPLGTLRISATERGICNLTFVPMPADAASGTPATDRPILRRAAKELTEYFAGHRSTFTVPLDLFGTRFQRAVWQHLTAIPFGRTVTYGEVAAALGNPGAYQAVGAANGRNPVAIMVPCHRVLGHKGKLTGYAGGVERKQWLLRHEAVTLL